MSSTENKANNVLSVGIDLGTTNSVLATVNIKPNGDIISKVVEIPRAYDVYNTVSAEVRFSTRRNPTLPSFVFYRQEKNYEPLVGDFAKLQYPLRPYLVAKSIKSQMGKPFAENLSPDIPDKTPAQISSRILQHLLREASRIYKCNINEAVITVPANFDSLMCKATQDAAELAGIKVRNSDGSERPILLSEPNAVIYDLINQIRNGELGDNILDLSSMKRVLVFDLGGGTLDITMHEIKRRDEASDILKVDEIATNRYTSLGGDDFDKAVAAEMFKRYQRQYSKNPDVVSLLTKKKDVVMPQLITYAENVKLDLSMYMREGNNNSYSSGWDDDNDDEEVKFNTGGAMGGIGYSYDDTFTKAELESILNPFMAENLNYYDYKRFDEITDTKNIIYPVLDVLKKASEKLNTPDIKIDAVIMNGGMSNFYMITDRLKKFFGFEPILALDPDLSVARGAAVYHHLLRLHAELQDDMRKVNSDSDSEYETLRPAPVNIEWGKTILNDALYMGVKNGGVHMIIPTGASLPYESEIMTGFKIAPLQKRIEIPIKSQNIDGTYRTIANGNIQFNQVHSEEAFVVFTIYMSESKVISMRAWTSYDPEGHDVMEVGTADIAIENISSENFVPEKQTLNASNEIRTLVKLCSNFIKAGAGDKRSDLAQRLRECSTKIINSANRSEFTRPILEALSNRQTNEEAKMRLFILARRLANEFSSHELELKQLANLCMQQINGEIYGIGAASGAKVNSNIQAIYTLSICGSLDNMKRLEALHLNERYRSSCLYAHAKTRTSIKWIVDIFSRDIETAKNQRRAASSLQVSAHAVAVALKNDEECPLPPSERQIIINKLVDTVNNKNITSDILVVCVLALGTICDNRILKNTFPEATIKNVERCIEMIPRIYSLEAVSRVERNCEVALKMIRGEELNADEEKYLLTKLEI